MKIMSKEYSHALLHHSIDVQGSLMRALLIGVVECVELGGFAALQPKTFWAVKQFLGSLATFGHVKSALK